MNKKIVVIPLDERPCNHLFHQMLGAMTPYTIVTAPKQWLGKKKTPGDPEALYTWLAEAIKDAHGAVIAVDTLLYSGIIPSRLHNDTEYVLLNRLNRLRKIKADYPHLTLYAYSLIMRNPKYSSAEEEPDYYEIYGRDIHRYGVITHKQSLKIETQEEQAELKIITQRLPKEHLDDYIHRRGVNLALNRAFLNLIAEGVIDFGIVPQDDSSPYGLTAIDQNAIRQTLRDLEITMKAYMYPGADEVTNVLMTKMILQAENRQPKIYPYYASERGRTMIPAYEDRPLCETVKYQIRAAGAVPVDSVEAADLLLLINVAGGVMHEASSHAQQPIEYAAFRNLIDAVHTMASALNTGQSVIIADVAYANGGDPELFELLKETRLLYQIHAYAGWNTSSNTLGTAIPHGLLVHQFSKSAAHWRFLVLRYAEDIGYCTYVRSAVANDELSKRKLDYFNLDGPDGIIATEIQRRLQAFVKTHLHTETFKPSIEQVRQPWNRMFETEITVTLKGTEPY